MSVISLQSEVVFGHVGNGAARLALQRLGQEVWAIPTVLFSNHAGYPSVAGGALPVEKITSLVDGLLANGWLPACDAVLSGYLGAPEQAAVVADTVRRVKAANPQALYCLDPVFGDGGRIYAKPGVEDAMARTLLPLADIVTPNAFELGVLSGLPIANAADARRAAQMLPNRCVAVTSVPCGHDRIGTLVCKDGEVWLASTSLLKNVPSGAGDLFAALFLGQTLIGHTPSGALELATRAVFHVLARSVAAQSREMLLVAEQSVLDAPPSLPDLKLEKTS